MLEDLGYAFVTACLSDVEKLMKRGKPKYTIKLTVYDIGDYVNSSRIKGVYCDRLFTLTQALEICVATNIKIISH